METPDCCKFHLLPFAGSRVVVPTPQPFHPRIAINCAAPQHRGTGNFVNDVNISKPPPLKAMSQHPSLSR